MNYIEEYHQKIKSGEILAGKWIIMWYDYIIDGLKNSRFFYDDAKATRAINFIETFCRHHEGPLAPGLLKLELWQKAFLSVIFGIVNDKGLRQFREVLLICGRKNGKSLLQSAIAAYLFFADGEYGARVYFTAPKLDQARICYEAFFQMILKEEELSSLVKKRRTDIYCKSTNSSAQPWAFSDKKSDGLNISVCICDEVAAWDGNNGKRFYEVLGSSTGARLQPLILSISTANYLNDGVYDELRMRAIRILQGNSEETTFAPFLYEIDDINKWDDLTELQKSMPNLGVSVFEDSMKEEIRKAHSSFSKRAEFITKYCNIKQNSVQNWISTQTVKKCMQNAISLEDFRGMYAVVGVDLSESVDLSSCSVIVEKDGITNVLNHYWLPGGKIQDCIVRDDVDYWKYVNDGVLSLSGDTYIEYRDIYNYITGLVETYGIYPLVIGYDKWSAKQLVSDLKAYGFLTDDVQQYFNLSPVLKEMEAKMEAGEVNIGFDDLTKMHFLNAAVKQDKESNKIRLIKSSAKLHIDGVMAAVDGLTVKQKWYEQYGEQLKNKKTGGD